MNSNGDLVRKIREIAEPIAVDLGFSICRGKSEIILVKSPQRRLGKASITLLQRFWLAQKGKDIVLKRKEILRIQTKDGVYETSPNILWPAPGEKYKCLLVGGIPITFTGERLSN